MNKEADRNARQELINSFFKNHGLGNKLRTEYDRIMEHLELPDHLQDYYKKANKHSNTKSTDSDEILLTLQNNFSENKICIFPSLYKFLIYLYKENVQFSVVLRTFGTDLPMIIKELN